MTKVVNL
jgi:hypothetical protein